MLFIYSHSSDLLPWHWGNRMIAPVAVKQAWSIWVKSPSPNHNITYRKANRVHNSWDIPITIQRTPDIWRCQYNTLLSSRTALKYIIKSEHWNQYSNLTNYTPCFAHGRATGRLFERQLPRDIGSALYSPGDLLPPTLATQNGSKDNSII